MHTVVKQPLAEGDANSGTVKAPFTFTPLGESDEWPVLDTTEIGLPTPTIEDWKRLLGY